MKNKLNVSVRWLILCLSIAVLSSCSVKGMNQELLNTENRLQGMGLAADKRSNQGLSAPVWVSGKEIVFKDTGKDQSWLKRPQNMIEAGPVSFASFVASMQSYGTSVIVTSTPTAKKFLDDLGEGGEDGGIEMKYVGNYAGLFDAIAAQGGVSWRSTADKTVHFFKYEEKTFTILSLQSSSNMKTAQEGGSYSSTQSLDVNAWADLQEIINGILSEEGKATLSPSLGVIVVRDLPSIIIRISSIIDKLNNIMKKQIIIDLEMIQYRSNIGGSAIADLQVIFASATESLQTIASIGTGTTSAAIIDPLSNLNGTSFSTKALRDTGNISQIMRRSIIAANNTPVPFVTKSTLTYLAKLTGGAVSDTGTVTKPSVEVDTVDTSVNIMIYPRIISEDQVMMQVSIKISNLDSLREIVVGSGSGSTKIEAPNVSETSFDQVLFLKDGATLMLSGNAMVKLDQKESKGLFGYSKTEKKSSEEMVILITPHILN